MTGDAGSSQPAVPGAYCSRCGGEDPSCYICGSSQPAERAVGAVPVDHPEGSTSPTPLPSGSPADGAHRPSEHHSQPADTRIETISNALYHAEMPEDRYVVAKEALDAVAAELANLREALGQIASGEGLEGWKRGISAHGEVMLIARAALSRGATP